MHQTTVRFGPDLWQDIEAEAERAGVSVAQYVRDSAMMRVGDVHYERALEQVEVPGGPEQDDADWSAGTRESAVALRAESSQARRQAQAIRDAARRRRELAARGEQPPAGD
jgi:hypothetical protein